MRIAGNMLQRNVLADLNRVQSQYARTSDKITSGKEIAKPSDDPTATARALQLHLSLDGVRQYSRNISDAVGWQSASETALATVTDYAQRARDLLIQGSSDSTDPAGRAAIADEVDQIIDGLKDTANSTFNGRFIFGGTRTDQPPYADATADAYQGAAVAISRQIGPGVALDIGVDAASFLGSGGGDGKLIDTLRTISAHLRAGDTGALGGSDIAKLDAGLDTALAVRAENGARQNRLEAAADRLSEVEGATLVELSEIEDVDLAKALTDYNTQQAAFQAALKAGANIIQPSLIDFLR